MVHRGVVLQKRQEAWLLREMHFSHKGKEMLNKKPARDSDGAL